MSSLDVLRAIVPQPLRKPIRHLYEAVPPGIRMGRKYWRLRAFLDDAQGWDRPRIEAWQLEKLKEIIRYAYDNVPGYTALYRESGVAPDDIRTLDDVRRLPFTDKTLMRENLDDFTSRTVNPRRLLRVASSGSTGQPFAFYRTDINRWMELAFLHSAWARLGWRIGEPAVVLRGGFTATEGHTWEYDYGTRSLKLSGYHLTDATYAEYIEKIRRFGCMHLQAYPSAATLLADLVVEHGDVGRVEFNTILLGSENFYPWQKERLLRAFPGAGVHCWYGHSEQAVLAPWCEHTSDYHVWPFYGVTEILDEGDREVDAGESGEIVATSFWNFGVPFIRYRTMDRARKGRYGCDACKRPFLLLDDIEGRLQEYVVDANGRRIPMTGLSVLRCFDNVRQCQFHQHEPGVVTLRVVRKDSYTDADTAAIREAVTHKLGDGVTFDVEFVERIAPTGSGKLRFLDQQLNLGIGD